MIVLPLPEGLLPSQVTPLMVTDAVPGFYVKHYPPRKNTEEKWAITYRGHYYGAITVEKSDRTYFCAYPNKVTDLRPDRVCDCFIEAAAYVCPEIREAFRSVLP